MITYTVAKSNASNTNKLVIIGIQFNIYESDNNIKGIKFKLMNCSNQVCDSLTRATMLFQSKNSELLNNKSITVSLTSTSIYKSPYLTALILYCYMCWKYKIFPPEKYVIFGDLNNDGNSTNETFSIINNFNKYYPDKKLLYNMSYDEIEAKVAIQKIELSYIKYKFAIDNVNNNDDNDNYYIEI